MIALGKKPEKITTSVAVWTLLWEDMGFPCGSDGKQSACSVGDPGSIPGSGRSPGEGNGNPFQLFVVYLKFKFDRGVMYLWASKVA